MSGRLPTRPGDWRQAAKRNNIDHTQSLSAGTDFVSGSKFEVKHFLRLRVLYIEEARPKTLANSPGFPRESLNEIEQILKKDAHASFLKKFLQGRENLGRDWNADKAKKAGKFAVAMENLHLIANRKVREMKDDEDIDDRKIISSPPKPRLGAHYHEISHSTTAPSTPTPRPQQFNEELSAFDNSNDDFGMSFLSMDSPEQAISAPNSDLRGAIHNFERSGFSPGDEQTVNAALVALIMALSWILGHTGRVHHDRIKLSIPKDDKTYLYSACVDGVIKHLNRDEYNGFMEVKRAFRAENSSVRRQIAAQMAAFIYEQDAVPAEKEIEKETKAPGGKGKKAKAEEDKIEDDGGGNQKQFRKWMLSLDGYFAYINIATYDRKYVEFLSGSQPSAVDDTFMEMVEYGSFDLRVWSGVGLEMFLTHVGALMLGTVGP